MKSNASRHLVDVAPASNPAARAEKVATKYKQKCKDAAALELEKKELGAKLLRLTTAIGEPDDEGKVRAATASWSLVIVESSNSRLDPKILMKLGVSARIIKKATVKQAYKYVSVSEKKEDTE